LSLEIGFALAFAALTIKDFGIFRAECGNALACCNAFNSALKALALFDLEFGSALFFFNADVQASVVFAISFSVQGGVETN
jgi:hypothetical protein